MTEEGKLILERIDEMGNQFNARMDKIDSRMDKMDSRMDKMDSKMDKMNSRMDKMDARIEEIDSGLKESSTRMDQMEVDIKGIKIDLENVINRNIQLVAEGHLDLSRKLDEALKTTSMNEMNNVRLNILEQKVRKIEKTVFPEKMLTN